MKKHTLRAKLEGPFTAIARAQSKHWGVTIQASGSALCTDGEVIKFPWNGDDIGTIPFQVLNGYLDHEVGHVAEEREHRSNGKVTPMDMMRSQKNRTKRMLLNVFEDIRMEFKRGREYPGVQDNLRAANVHSVETFHKRFGEVTGKRANFWHTLGCGIIMAARGLDTSWLPDGYAPYMALCQPEIDASRTTVWAQDNIPLINGVYDKVTALAKALMDYEEEKTKPDTSKGASGEGDESQGEDGESTSSGSDGDSSDTEGEGAEGDDTSTDDSEPSDDSEGSGSEKGDDSDDSEGSGSEKGDDSDDSEGSSADQSDDGDSDGDTESGEGASDASDDASDDTEGQDSDGDADDAKGTTKPTDTHTDGQDDPSDGSEDDGSDIAPQEPTPPCDNADEAFDLVDGALDEADTDDIVKDELGKEIQEVSEALAKSCDGYIPNPKAAELDAWITPEKGSQDAYNKIKGQVAMQVSALRAKLIRIIRTRTESRVQYDKEHGRLDTSRLHQLRLGSKRVFSQTVKGDDLDTAVTILVDLSGSMGYADNPHGRAHYARLTTVALAEALDAIGVPFEVIGWNNTYKHGRDYGSLWSDGPFINRLPFEFHVYKSFAENHRQVRTRMVGITGMEENVDGEAVLATAKRLASRPESRKLMFVISDGAPVCPGLLTSRGHSGKRHLHKAIKDVRGSGIILMGIGVQHGDVSSYYGVENSILINKLDEMAVEIFKTVRAALLAGLRRSAA